MYPVHRGVYMQRGRGLGGIFASLSRFLRPMFTKGISIGRKALSEPALKQAVNQIKNESIKAGTRAINQQLGKIASTPKAKQPISVKKAQKRVAGAIGTNKIPRKKKAPTYRTKAIF